MPCAQRTSWINRSWRKDLSLPHCGRLRTCVSDFSQGFAILTWVEAISQYTRRSDFAAQSGTLRNPNESRHCRCHLDISDARVRASSCSKYISIRTCFKRKERSHQCTQKPRDLLQRTTAGHPLDPGRVEVRCCTDPHYLQYDRTTQTTAAKTAGGQEAASVIPRQT